MWNKIRGLLHPESDEGSQDQISTAEAVSAILVYTARLDQDYDRQERAHVLELLKRQRWGGEMTPEALVLKAEKLCDEALDCYGFLRVLGDSFDEEDRLELLRMMWQVVMIDGVLDEYEANMMRRITGLLGISDSDSGRIRNRVLDGANEN